MQAPPVVPNVVPAVVPAVAPVVPAAQPAAVPAAPGPPVNQHFGKSPGLFRASHDLNMTVDADMKLYEKATAGFMKKNELFDLSSGRLLPYLAKLTKRCSEYGWNDAVTGITFIPEDPLDAASEIDNLLTGYGQISIARIRAFEATYLHLPIRAANDSDMLYKCQMESLTEGAISKLMLESGQFHVNGEPSGNLLLKTIIMKSSLDSNASTSIIRNKLAKLDLYMPLIKSNIREFHEYVQTLMYSLTVRNEETKDLLVHLFAAYKVASDASFRKLAADEEVRYEQGTAMTAEGLMAVMLNRYEVLTDKGEWNAPSQEEEQLMVMRAELESMKNEKKKGGNMGKIAIMRKIKEKFARKAPTNKKYNNNKYKGKSYKEDPEWLANNEKPSPLTKTMNHRNKAWHWCSVETGGKCGGRWRVHKPSECKGLVQGGGSASGSSNNNSSNELKLMKVLNAVIGDDDEVCRMVEEMDLDTDEE
jgi:hypothetical protein